MSTSEFIAAGYFCNGHAFRPEGSKNIPSRFILQRPAKNGDLMGHLPHMQTSPLR